MYKIFEKPLILEAKEYVKDLISSKKDYLFFHQYNHFLEVAYRAVEIGIKEGLGEEKLEILAISGIFHDSGFSLQYDNNEEFGAKIAEDFLKKKGYPKEKIEIIKSIILATILDREPNNILEEIIKDADLDNLGRNDFFDKTMDLKKEVEINKNKKITNKDWFDFTLKLAYNQKFYTKTANNERLLKKMKNIEKLKEILAKK